MEEHERRNLLFILFACESGTVTFFAQMLFKSFKKEKKCKVNWKPVLDTRMSATRCLTRKIPVHTNLVPINLNKTFRITLIAMTSQSTAICGLAKDIKLTRQQQQRRLQV